jgi:hypothetical protein
VLLHARSAAMHKELAVTDLRSGFTTVAHFTMSGASIEVEQMPKAGSKLDDGPVRIAGK